MLDRSYVFPSEDAFAITPSDTAVFTTIGAIYVGGAGNITVRVAKTGQIVTYSNVPAGTYLRIQVDMVRSTGTTATNLVGQR